MSMASRPVAVVTGASRAQGIGAAVCRLLAQMQFDIYFTWWGAHDAHDARLAGAEQAETAALRATVAALGVRCACAEVDLGQPDAAAQIMDAAEAALGPVSVLVNNAAHDDTNAPFDQLTAAIFDRYYAVNMRGTMLLSIEFARRFSRGSGGRIINLTSGQGLGPMPGKLPYIATKGAIEAFTVTLAAEVASRSVTVNAVDPGPTDTGWISDDPALLRALTEQAPFGRVGQPDDAARLIAFLASPASAWITGQIIHSRGGL